MIETTFREKWKIVLFIEQAVLFCSCMGLIQVGFDRRVEASDASQRANFECMPELMRIADRPYSDSNTTKHSNLSADGRIIDNGIKQDVKALLDVDQSGGFVRKWMAKWCYQTDEPEGVALEFERNDRGVRTRLRVTMPWLTDIKCIDKSKH